MSTAIIANNLKETTKWVNNTAFQRDQLFELDEDDGYEGRCGEIYITRKHLLIYHCSLCDNTYGGVSELLRHISSQHFDVGMNIYKDALIKHEDKTKATHHDFEQQAPSEDLGVDILDEEYEDVQMLVDVVTAVNPVKSLESEQDELEQLPIDKLMQNDTIQKIDTMPENVLQFQNVDNISTESPQDNSHESSSLTSPNRTYKLFLQKITDEKETNAVALLCKICERTFVTKRKLRAHMNTHTNERRFKCDQCGFAFKAEFNLRAHVRRHLGQRQFSCEKCDKQFFTRNELKTHERRHTGERPFTCTQCGMGFISSGSLGDHMKRHTNNRPHKCQHCEKRFFDTYQLKEHLAVHTQEKTYGCSDCSARFSRHKSLVSHKKLHTNAREYVCDFCDATLIKNSR